MWVAIPIVSFICVILALIPLPLHWRTRNVATLSLIFWLVLGNIVRGINSVIWSGTTAVKYKVWCDISIRLLIGVNFAVPASVFCICRFLAQVACPRDCNLVASNKRRRMIFDLVMCVGLPMVFMALYYVVQTNRFSILEDFGCEAPVHMSVLGLFIMYLPSVLVSLAALVYAGIALRWFIYRRAQFQAVLQSTNSGLTTNHYVRFITLSTTQMFYTAALSTFTFITHIKCGLKPYLSWNSVHTNFQHIEQIPRDLPPLPFWMTYFLAWSIAPMSSVLFFIFFGFGREAKLEYIRFFRWVFRIKPEPVSIPSASESGMRGANPITVSFGMSPIITKHTEITMSTDNVSPSTRTISRPPSPVNKQVNGGPDAQVRFAPIFPFVSDLTTYNYHPFNRCN
ncbi:Pheromone B beta 1 receptor [Ceratobasidium theobromae]|uniref:Pheromone B beta 1 receptor n=1 Tax=Ceratobasidium theobromae TaxID=1582974 RepID=A0A5N5Q9C5_9AGAM|nr:Pheromone B beta 1 receptor [Ceratobasidium theobromae]